METHEFHLEGEYIELISLLKFLGIASTGGHAKEMVDAGEVSVNGVRELRKRYKVRTGDRIELTGHLINVLTDGSH